jgi:dTDP-4-amino-4,6-dideoxygalactose transaminase
MTNKVGVGHFETTPRMRELINVALDNNRLSYGPLCREFESKFARAHNAKFAVLSNSGTSALQVALQAMKELHGWNDGDEVLIPAVTFVATANIVLHNRMIPVPVDVNEFSYNIAPGLLGREVNPRTKAIIPVHLFGQMANMSRIHDIVNLNGLRILEDSCECMFATHRGKYPGEYGDIAAFSTYIAHLISTGVGGISTTDNPDYAAKMRSLVNHGRDGIYVSIDDDNELGGAALKEVISRRFRFESIGHSYRITELEAAIGLAQLEEAQEMIRRRRLHADYLSDGLSPHLDRLATPTAMFGNTHSFMMYPIVLRNEEKWGLCNALENAGIETREMMPLTNQPAYTGLFDPDAYPVAKWINTNGFYVGCHHGMELDDLDRIVSVVDDYFTSC